MLLSGRVGPQVTAENVEAPIRLARTEEVCVTDTHARYYEAIARGNVYYLAQGATAGTAFTGGAAGTPLIGIYNPSNSGKNLVVLAASIGVTTIQTAAGQVNPELWAGISVLPTGTVTAAKNALTQSAAGSSAVCFLNTAMTGSTAITFFATLGTFWWATAAAGAMTSNGFYDIGGALVAAPGVLIALGLRTIPTATVTSHAMIWEEVPV